ncbi:MAG TPA: hypothetical protein VKD72_30435, partial [Gemmataceae bacterium]|nr:hypothetical protein [Gemmataceae bacterium]
MWRTSLGDRVLRGAEWELFRTSLSCVWDLVEESFGVGDLFESGIDAFDDLQPGQKLALLALVGKALRDEAAPTPPLTAHNEAAIAAVFENVRQSIELEADAEGEAGTPSGGGWSWRRAGRPTPGGGSLCPRRPATTPGSGTPSSRPCPTASSGTPTTRWAARSWT